MTSQTNYVTTEETKQSIFVDGVLFDLDLFWWKGWVKLSAQDIEKTEEEIPDIIKLGQIRILKHETFRDFEIIENKSRPLVDKLSYPFMISTVRFVPFSVLPQLIEELEILKKAFYLFVENFNFYYQDYKTSFLNHYPQLRDRIQGKYPDPSIVEGRFFFGWTLFEMSLPRNIRATLIQDQESLKLQEAWQSSQADIDIKLDRWVDTVGISMRKEISLICKNMKDSLDAGKIIRQSTLEKARENIRRLRNMNFIGDKQVEALLDNLSDQIPNSFDREVPVIMGAFSKTLGSLIDESKDISDVSEFTGQYKRKFII
tara:strand:+ start:611 stop:1555 length:945 start_codon:yes stop_codon:yes gene_type:complete